MRSSRPLTRAVLAALCAAAVVTGLGAGPSASADAGTPSDLYVSNQPACNSGTTRGDGTQASPFCSIQQAADVVLPGQSIVITNYFTSGSPFAGFTLSRSGTPSQPITFEVRTSSGHGAVEIAPPMSPPQGWTPVTLRNVHDVAMRGLTLERTTDAVDVTGSQNITLDQLTLAGSVDAGDGVRIDGTSSGVTVSRSALLGLQDGHAVEAAAGAHDIAVTTNQIEESNGSAVALDGTTAAAVTSNSFYDTCGSDVALTGGSAGSVENNTLGSGKESANANCPEDPVVAVDAASQSRVTSDYNDFTSYDAANRASYGWGGTTYATPAARTGATDDGTHDHYGSALLNYVINDPTGIDAANADAPGELATDVNGFRHGDDPSVSNTGTGSIGYADRGAVELHDTVTVPGTVHVTPPEHIVPFTATVPVGDATDAWGEPLTYSVDFGDGGQPVTGTAADPPQHTYTVAGLYTETVTMTDTDGVSQSLSVPVIAGTVDAVPATLTAHTVQMDSGAVGGQADFTFPTTGDFERDTQFIDFGDGTTGDVLNGEETHQYPGPGIYPATLTRTDLFGRTSTAKTVFTASDEINVTAGAKTATATIAAHGTWTAPGSALGLYDTDPAELRVNATGAADGGWLTAYPAGGTRPSASTLNFPAGHDASNQETVVPGASNGIAIYNGAASSAKVSVVTVASYSPAEAGSSYHPTNPTTLLDTRNGTGGVSTAVGAGKSVTVKIAGVGSVPANATAVTLDVAENTTKASGSLSVAPHGTTGKAVTTSYWAAGESVTNLVTLPLTDGQVTLTNNSTGTANLIAALDGWYGADATGSGAWPVAPTRVLNTQTGLGETGGKPLKLAPGATLKVKVAGTASLPATGLTAADLNLTVSAPTTSGWLVAYPDDTTRPTAGAVNYTKDHTIAGQALIKVGADGYIDLYNPTTTAIDVFADIHGGYVPMS
ncbi:PKD domain-containing protein [Streptomyces sp. SL13]|uniref:PKD domain-containing protein n=1 Tax=Streptantibioticus silvisoli TaxID=2705255 RepID=A0AA90H1S9_9ACTN|nr:PKD domain-containing protein [Streptantibioticus silvisoli]MDI5969428.1 PKD domain-containing protein [Streptantibioticus silvisoli]